MHGGRSNFVLDDCFTLDLEAGDVALAYDCLQFRSCSAMHLCPYSACR